MNNSISLFDKMKENQNCILALKKTANEIYLDMVKKVEELNSFHKSIASQTLKLKERKEEIAGLESEAQCLNLSLATWKTMLNNKKLFSEKEKEDLRASTNLGFSNRIVYCNKVNYFLTQTEDLMNIDISSDTTTSNAELRELHMEVKNLVQELESKGTTIKEDKSKRFNADLTKTMRMEEIRLEKYLNDRKNELKRLASDIRLRSQKNCSRLEHYDHSPTTVESVEQNTVSNYCQNTSPMYRRNTVMTKWNSRQKFVPKRRIFSKSQASLSYELEPNKK